MDEIVVGIDVGTTKVCTLVGRVEEEDIRIMGVGIEPSVGIKKGVIVDLAAASQAITRSVEKAEQSSGVEITGAVVSLAGAHISSINSRGVAGITNEVVDEVDVARALEAARAVAIPHNREVIHIIQRGFSVDGQDGILTPLGMHGYRLEVEAGHMKYRIKIINKVTAPETHRVPSSGIANVGAWTAVRPSEKAMS